MIIIIYGYDQEHMTYLGDLGNVFLSWLLILQLQF